MDHVKLRRLVAEYHELADARAEMHAVRDGLTEQIDRTDARLAALDSEIEKEVFRRPMQRAAVAAAESLPSAAGPVHPGTEKGD